ncbi:Bacterio-opsin activator HTH domain protein [Natrinema pellirubrum DSM 15624]|uniref:Bacterio-opsin activator HTH domain protein n=1 Tax=Natrinema pellirubrum (strain DSM 15624 / CIP 106293 / JCM 10476 / NCIMB 786 / 157) TaxID=797303 RepID=L0JGR0_NATP1|nr:helix-turn-helix domain-containing protein [Natrinema pellirubrum]AGB30489.1 putative DNA binding protein [Natrinema pellirubrum DSM 15624]ELY77257.1 Bacterio-opsin activator HTH domain protein [Natrinema pellirubrum DSM 15624]
MSTIADLRLPAAETALATAFERAPAATFELESSVSKTRPSLWVADVDRETVDAAFDADPSVAAAELLVETDSRLLYDVTFADDAGTTRLWEDLLVDGGSLLEARASDGWWQVTVRYRDRETLCEAYERLLDRGINVELRRVTDVTDTGGHATRLTPEQQEALEAALEYGYFEIPRGVSMEELADELGISHQALSERFRRAYETLVDAELQPAGEGSRFD